MKPLSKTILTTLVSGMLLSSASSDVLFQPFDVGQASGSSNYPLQGAFDDQPDISDLPIGGLNLITSGNLGSNVPSFASDNGIRVGYIDFGEDYSEVQIIELWTAYRNYSSYDGNSPFLDLWWADSSTLTTEWSGGINLVQKPTASTTDITNPDFNFGTQPANTGGSTVLWARDVEFDTPVTPERRYLMLAASMQSNTTGQFAAGRATELAILVVPEPFPPGEMLLIDGTSQVTLLSGEGDSSLLFSEQDTIGDPRDGTVGIPEEGWRPSWQFSDYPVVAIIDLGQVHLLSDIYFFDAHSDGLIRMEAEIDGEWVLLFEDPQTSFLHWIGYPADVETHKLRFTSYSRVIPNEMVLYGSLSSSGNPPPADPDPGPVSEKINVNDAVNQVTLINGDGNPSLLFSEQDTIGDPRAGTGGIPEEGWRPSWQFSDYPVVAIIDLGQVHLLSDIYFFDAHSDGLIRMEAEIDGEWVLLFEDTQTSFLHWIGYEVDVETDRLRFTSYSRVIPNEFVLYGTLASAGDPPPADPVSEKIEVDPARIINLPAVGDAGLLFSQQDTIGDPRGGTGGIPEEGWRLGYNDRYYPATAIIDLGGTCQLTDIYFYDGAGTGLLTIEARENGEWVLLVSDEQTAYNVWSGTEVDIEARYLRLTAHGKNVIPNELALYGWRIGEIEPIPDPTPHTPPTFDQFMGINVLVNDPLGRMEPFGTIREFSNWSWVGGTQEDHPSHPNEENRFERAYVGGWNFDLFYQNLDRMGIDTVVCRQASVGWMGLDNLEHKPIPSGSGRDSEDPASYIEHADHLFQMAARYGSVEVPEHLLKLDPDEPKKSGLGTLRYLENWNEPNKTWHQIQGYFSAAEFAAMSSADADGHLGTLGAGVGMKQADPDMLFVMGGLIGIDIEYIKAMQWWFDNHREGDFPFDVINVHHYSNDGGGQNETRTRGISPEADQLRERMEELRDFRDRFYPGREIWLSEFGYDVHQDSPQRAPAIGTLTAEEVQAAWIVRSYLALAAAGVDRAHLYMLRDANTLSGGLYSSCGLLADHDHGYQPRPAWYFCRTLGEHLRGLRFHSEEFAEEEDVLVYNFADEEEAIRAIVVWSGTEVDNTIEGVEVSLPAGTTEARKIQFADGEPLGIETPLTVIDDSVNLTVTEIPTIVLVGSERPVRAMDTKLDLSTATVVQESGQGDASLLFDEQILAGDPNYFGRAAGKPETGWSPGPGSHNYPASAYVDLGEVKTISKVYLFDTNNSGTVSIQIGEPGNWQEVSTDPLRQWQFWSPHVINEPTRYLRFTREPGSNFAEVVVYTETWQ